jgi:hypothetical protein
MGGATPITSGSAEHGEAGDEHDDDGGHGERP